MLLQHSTLESKDFGHKGPQFQMLGSPQIVPVNFGLKYRPPKLGLQYHFGGRASQTFVHEIPLGFVTAKSDIDQATNSLMEQHAQYLHPKIVNPSQIRRLVERLVLKLKEQTEGNKENVPENLKISPKKKTVSALEEKGKPQPFSLGMRILETSPLVDDHRGLIKHSIMDTSPPPLRDNHPQQLPVPLLSANKQEAATPGQHFTINENDLQDSSIGQHLLMSGMGSSQLDEGSEQKDFSKMLLGKEKMMGSTIRDLGNTIKEAKNFLMSKKGADLFQEDGVILESERSLQNEDEVLQGMSACVENAEEEDNQTTNRDLEQQYQEFQGAPEDDDVIDIDNPEDLAAKGLKRIQIDGEEDEYLMDMEGNIYDLQGNFIGTTDGEEQAMHQEFAEEGAVSMRLEGDCG